MKSVLRWFGTAKGKGAGFSLMSSGNLLIALFTYLRFAEIARIFGTTWKTDAVSLAMVIPLLLQQLISTAFGAAFMPIYSRVRAARGMHAANQLISRIINWMSLTGAVLIGAVLATGSFVVGLVGPGAEPSTLVLASKLLQIFLPLIFLNAIEGVIQNFLIYGKRYGLVSFVRVLQIFISYITLLAWHGEMGIYIIPISGLIGAFVSFMTTAVMAYILKMRLFASMDPSDRDFRDLVRLAVPVTVGVVTGFLGPVADKALASFLRTSSVTAIDYAGRIRNLVRIILIQPVIVLCTVSFSRIAAEGRLNDLKREISDFVRNVSYYSVPAAGIFTVLSVQLISVFFQRGNFGPQESRLVGYALAFYAPWFAQQGIGLIMRRAFFAMKESVTPVVLGVWSMLANILLNVILLVPLGIGGLALATTLTSTAKTILLTYFLRKRLGGVGGREFVPELLRILLGTGVLVAYMLAAGRIFPFDLNDTLAGRLLNLSLAVVPGVILYVSFTWLTGSRTCRSLIRMFNDRVLRRGNGKGPS